MVYEMSKLNLKAEIMNSKLGTPSRVRTCDLRLRRPPNPTIPTTFTEVLVYVQVSHRRLMLGAVAVNFSRQTISA